MSDDQDETPIDRALEVFVYAPMGFALEARSLLPRFVERGRNQVALARVVGRFAVRKGREDVEARLLDGQETAVGLLRSLGVVAPAEVDDRTARPVTAPAATAATSPAPSPAPAPVPDVPEVEVDSLPIPGYDSLSASQVVPRLESLSADELERVRWYEAGNRGRKTILTKIAQLQSV